MQVGPSRSVYDPTMGIEELVPGDNGPGDKDQGAEDKICRDLCDETVDKRVTGKVVECKSRERAKKGILGNKETSYEQKGKGKEAAERTHDEIQKGSLKM